MQRKNPFYRIEREIICPYKQRCPYAGRIECKVDPTICSFYHRYLEEELKDSLKKLEDIDKIN